MSSLERPPNVWDLRKQRERSADWINYASWTAIGTASLGVFVVLTVGLSQDVPVELLVPLVSTLLAQGLVGYQLGKTRSEWAAWVLTVVYLAGAVIHLLQNELLSGILIKIVIGYIYVRGVLAAGDYKELDKQIRADGLKSVTRDLDHR